MQNTLTQITQGAYKLAVQILHQPADAEDVLQDAVSIAITHKKAPDTSSVDFKAWFYKVVHNKSIDKLREQKRKQTEALNEETMSEYSPSFLSPEHALQRSQLQLSLQEALQALPTQQREMVLLKDYHQMSYLQIAELLDVPKGTVMSSLHRARIALQTLLVKAEVQ